MTGKRPSVFAVTQNGKTRYCISKIYGGLAGTRPLFDRFDRVLEISEADWRRIADKGSLRDDYYSRIEIDSDAKVVRVDENWHREGERRCAEVALDKLLETAGSLIESNRYSGYPSLDKSKFYTRVRGQFIRTERSTDETYPSILRMLC